MHLFTQGHFIKLQELTVNNPASLYVASFFIHKNSTVRLLYQCGLHSSSCPNIWMVVSFYFENSSFSLSHFRGDCIIGSWAVCFRGSVLEVLCCAFCSFQGLAGICACVWEQPHLLGADGRSQSGLWFQLTGYWRHMWGHHLWGTELVSCKSWNCLDFKEFCNWISEKW